VSVVIKVLFVVLILSTAAIIAVGIAIYLRVRRHLETAHSEGEMTEATGASDQDDKSAQTAGASEGGNHGKSGDRDM
jgi:hypothetical protein